MDDAPLSATQRVLLPMISDDAYGFWELVWLDTNAQRPQEAAEALLNLFRRGYAEVYEAEPGASAQERLITNREVGEAAIQDLSNWKSPPDPMRERWYFAFVTPAGTAKWIADAESGFPGKPS